MRRVFERGRRGRGVGMIFFMGGPNSFFLAFRATSVIFWCFTPKPEFQKNSLCSPKFKKITYVIRF